jgi:hypothetical protein
MGWINWSKEAARRVASGGTGNGYREANADIIERAINGIGTISGAAREGEGVRVVYNMANAHLPRVLEHGYRNCYRRDQRNIGDVRPVSSRRTGVDKEIAAGISPSVDYKDIHYGAVELNGTGMRYYGDICVVLKTTEFDDDTVVLHRNSYDLTRSPMADRIALGTPVQVLIDGIAGRRPDVASMLVCKVIRDPLADERLLTVGHIAASLLHDEDYFEVVRLSHFACAHIEEIRVSAADTTLELSIDDRQRQGATPSLAELIWRYRREQACKAAAAHGIPYRVVTSDGRVRG